MFKAPSHHFYDSMNFINFLFEEAGVNKWRVVQPQLYCPPCSTSRKRPGPLFPKPPMGSSAPVTKPGFPRTRQMAQSQHRKKIFLIEVFYLCIKHLQLWYFLRPDHVQEELKVSSWNWCLQNTNAASEVGNWSVAADFIAKLTFTWVSWNGDVLKMWPGELISGRLILIMAGLSPAPTLTGTREIEQEQCGCLLKHSFLLNWATLEKTLRGDWNLNSSMLSPWAWNFWVSALHFPVIWILKGLCWMV